MTFLWFHERMRIFNTVMGREEASAVRPPRVCRWWSWMRVRPRSSRGAASPALPHSHCAMASCKSACTPSAPQPRPQRHVAHLAKQLGHAPAAEFAKGTRYNQTRLVVICRPSANSPTGALSNCFALLQVTSDMHQGNSQRNAEA